MKSGIYLIKNIINNKVYIGSAVNIDRRWEQHKKLLKKGKHHSCHLQLAWNKYGEQNFKFEILEEVSNPLHLVSYEQVYLDYHKCYEDERGYNICKVAGSPLGLRRSEEAKKKMSEAKTGIKLSEEHKQKLREAKTGKKRSEETKMKIRETLKGKVVSEEARQKMSEAQKGRKHTEEARQKMSEAHKGKIFSEERKQKLRETKKKMSEEHKRKISEALIGTKLSQEHKNKISKAARNMSEETKKKMSEAKRNSKKHKYYSFNKDKKKYRVIIWEKEIGYYNTEEEAKQAVIINLEKLKAQQIVSS